MGKPGLRFRATPPPVDGVPQEPIEATGVREFVSQYGLDRQKIYAVLARPNGGMVDGWLFERAGVNLRVKQPVATEDPVNEPPKEAKPVVRPAILNAIKSIEGGQRSYSDPVATVRNNYAAVSDLLMRATRGEQRLPDGFSIKDLDSIRKFFESEAERAWRISSDHIRDSRSEPEKAIDLWKDVLKNPGNILERTETEISAMVTLLDEADALVGEYLDDTWKKHGGERMGLSRDTLLQLIGEELEAVDPKVLRDRLQRWSLLLANLLKIRQRAKHPIPKCSMENHDPLTEPNRAYFLEAAHPARFMIYVGRSSTNGEGMHKPLRIYKHMARVFGAIWVAKNNVNLHPFGIYKTGEVFHHPVRNKPVVMQGDRWEGILIRLPPEHSKTTIVNHYVVLTVAMQHTTQAIMLGQTDPAAQRNLGYIHSCFSNQSSNGRRCLSLFPLKLASSDNNKSRLRVHTDERITQPTIVSCGIMSRGFGQDANLLVCDDIVPFSDKDQPTDREKRYGQLVNTWMSRLRAESGFTIVVGHPIHREDAVCRLFNLAKEGKARYVTCSQPCGGPDSSPAFKSIWPEHCPSRKLRSIFAKMPNRSEYSALYMMNPQDESERVIRKLRFYDQRSDDHQRFLDAAATVYHMSIDPSASNRPDADKAGLLWAAVGDIVTSTIDPNGAQTRSYRRVVRILDAENLIANMPEIIAKGGEWCIERRVDLVHIEAQGAFASMTAMWDEQFGVSAIAHTPAGKNKLARLNNVASMLDDSNPGIVPIVEFPGVTNEDGIVIADPRYQWFYEQILDFKMATDKGAVDALTQFLKHVGNDGDITGRGAASEAVRASMQYGRNPVYEHIMRRRQMHAEADFRDADMEDCAFVGMQRRM